MRLAARLIPVSLLLGLAACAPPPWQSERTLDLAPLPAGTTVYITPFTPILAPPEIADGILDRFVDGFNAATPRSGLNGVILKTPPEELDPAWLAARHRITGEVFAYSEDVGCCSVELKLGARVEYLPPAAERPTLRVTVPYDTIADLDRTTPAAEQERMIRNVADRLSDGIVGELSR